MQYNAPLRFIGGEVLSCPHQTPTTWPLGIDSHGKNADYYSRHDQSAGATLAALVMQHVIKESIHHQISGLVLNYGAFDLSYLPSCRMLDPNWPLVLSAEDAEKFIEAYVPGRDLLARKHPLVSPLYASLHGLGSALLIVGTVDGLLDDSILMAAKWQIAGNEAVLKFVPGAAHGFMTFDGSKVEVTRQGWDLMLNYIQNKLKG